MSNFGYKTIGNTSPQGKPRIYFCCHNSDFEKYFELISKEIFRFQNCAFWYRTPETIIDDLFFVDLEQMHLFVMPVTSNLLNTENDALSVDFKFAIDHHIPVLPLMQEAGLEELFNQKCGDLQFLDKNIVDDTAIGYEEKLEKYLSSVLIGDELAEKIRASFDAYVFLSYRKKDRKYAQELMRLIHKNDFCRDIAIWYDEFLTPGENFNDSIKHALQKSGLFVLAVTPNLVNETNYIMTTEYPMVQDAGKPILPAELIPTDRELLNQKYKDIPVPANAHSDIELSAALLESIKKMAILKSESSPEHNFFIGLAYLSGIDVEVNRELAVDLITGAAQNELPEAMVKLISMYSDGIGVSSDPKQVLFWSERLADYYFKRIFSKDGVLDSVQELENLFDHYNDIYWRRAIECFLLKVDTIIDIVDIRTMYNIVFKMGIFEYTLFFDACTKMKRSREETQILIITDILTKSVDGTYPPYGPLFWYVPEYDLYEVSLLTLNVLKNNYGFAKMLALVRDVCWIFGRFNTVADITARVQGEELFTNVELCGIRRGLCELFFTGDTSEMLGEKVYPRCFNIAEAKQWKEHRCGLLDRMPISFEDELGLYSHEMFCELGGEYIGIIASLYDQDYLENVLPQRSCKKMRGLFLSPTDKTTYERIAINEKNIQVCYFPENIISFNHRGAYSSAWILDEQIIYFYDTLFVPDGVKFIGNSMFEDCTSLTSAILSDSITNIGISAFKKCTSLKTIKLSKELVRISKGAFANCSSLTDITIPNKVIEIGSGAFCECAALASVTLSEKLMSIGNLAFSRCTALSSIVFPETLVKIGTGLFQGCTSLVSVSLSNGVSQIGSSVFEGCISLKSVVLPQNVTFIGYQAFQGCTSLTSIIIPPYVEDISTGAFCNCTSLKSIVLPESIKVIDHETFSNCSSLISINIPEAITEIGEAAFLGCTSLSSISIPKEVLVIKPKTFCNCKSLKEVILVDGLRKIDNNAFSECSSLSSIHFPNSLQSISDNAFYSCTSLVSILLPNAMRYFGKTPFKGCLSLRRVLGCPENISKDMLGVSSDCDISYCHNVLTSPKNEVSVATVSGEKGEISKRQFADCYDLQEVFVLDGITKINEEAFYNCTSLETIVLPEGITEIGVKAFENCTSLVSITLPKSVKKISRSAFSGCSSLEHIVLSQDLVEIGESAFRDCISLTSVLLPQSVEYIGERIFENCSSLISISLPERLLEISTGMFLNCTTLKSITIPVGTFFIRSNAFKNCTALESLTITNGIVLIGDNAFENCKALTSISIPSHVKDSGRDDDFKWRSSLMSFNIEKAVVEIGNSAFKGCSSLTFITIPETATKIGLHAFADCTSLKEITVLGDVKEIPQGAFSNCSSLETITFKHKITIIEEKAFSGCVSLSTITIQGDIKSIGAGAFEDCAALKSFALSDRITEITPSTFDGCTSLISVVIPSNVHKISFAAFRDCNSLTSISFPENLKTIDWFAFENCESIKDITIPNHVTQIGWSAFKNCRTLRYLNIPKTVRLIEGNAFNGCTELKEIYISLRFEDELTHIFGDVDISKATIHWI